CRRSRIAAETYFAIIGHCRRRAAGAIPQFSGSDARRLPGPNTIRHRGRTAGNQGRTFEENTGNMTTAADKATVSTERFSRVIDRARALRAVESRGRVVQLIGLVVESQGPPAAIGEMVKIKSGHQHDETYAEVVGFRNHHLLLMPLGETHGIHVGSEVIATGRA